MSNGPTALFDKSTIQMLSAEECRWFLHFFRGVLTPVFIAEVLGNLAKSFEDGRDPSRMVASMAAKTDALGTLPNVSHYDLIVADLLGQPVEMSERPLVGNAERLVTESGETGWFIDESPEDKILRKWREGSFEEAEFIRAARWRTYAHSFDCHELINICSDVPREIASDVGKMGLTHFREQAVESYSEYVSAWRGLKYALGVFHIKGEVKKSILRRWDAEGRKPLRNFAPYVFYVMCVIRTAMFGIGRRIISSRPTNVIDEQYLFYVPFASIFVSNDTMHKQLAPLFMNNRQVFIWATDMKRALGQFVVYYRNHTAELQAQGSMTFARFPPLELSTVIHEIYDQLRPSWRAEARMGAPKPISREESDRIMARLKPMRDAIEKLQRRKAETNGEHT